MLLATFSTVAFLLPSVMAGRTVSAPVRFVLPCLLKAIPSHCVILLSLWSQSLLYFFFLDLGFTIESLLFLSLSHTPLCLPSAVSVFLNTLPWLLFIPSSFFCLPRLHTQASSLLGGVISSPRTIFFGQFYFSFCSQCI